MGVLIKNVRKWEVHEIGTLVEASHRAKLDTIYSGIASDGARLGDPAEENVALLTWSLPANVGTYCPFAVTPM